MVDTSVFHKQKNFGDLLKLEEEFQLKKQLGNLQMKQLQNEVSRPNLEGLAEQSLFAYHQGQPMTKEGQAAIEALATLKGSSVKYQPDAFGNVRAVSEPNPYQQFLGGGGGDPLAASQAAISQRQQQIGANPYQGELEVEPMDLAQVEQSLGANSPALRMEGANVQPQTNAVNYNDLLTGVPDAGPITRQYAQETAVKTQAEKNKADYENQIALANEEIKTGAANSKVATVLNRMKQINESLKQKGAIVSSSDPYARRIAATAATTDLGQGIRKFNDPEAQALAEEYASLQATLLPYYASAAGLGAKSLDSEGERKSILSSFGSPAGIYDANVQQLETLSTLFGVGQNTNILDQAETSQDRPAPTARIRFDAQGNMIK